MFGGSPRVLGCVAANLRRLSVPCLSVVLGLAALLATRGAQATGTGAVAGVVVEAVGKNSALERAGVRPGDRLLSWEQPAQGGPGAEHSDFRDPFDWMWLEIERAPRAAIRLFGERDGQPVQFLVGPGTWETRVRPGLREPGLTLYQVGERWIDSGEIEAGAFVWERTFREEQEDQPDSSLLAWMHLRLGEIRADREEWGQAHEHYRLGLLSTPSLQARAILHLSIGSAYTTQEDFLPAKRANCQALQLWEELQVDGLGVATARNALGAVAWHQGDLIEAEGHWSVSWNLRKSLAPESLPLVESLMNLQNLAGARGDLERAEAYLLEAIAIAEKIAPDSLTLAGCLQNLGIVLSDAGELERARHSLLKSLEITRALAPESRDVAAILSTLGNLWAYSDLDTAEAWYRQALEIQEKIDPESLAAAGTLNNLAGVLVDRGDLVTARTYYDRAYRIYEKRSPESLDFAAILVNLAALSNDLGDLEAAEGLARRALLIQERWAPRSLSAAASLSILASLAQKRDETEIAETYFRRALEIEEKQSPDRAASTLASLGDLAWQRGDAQVAETYRLQALAAERKSGVDSLFLAILLNNLGNMAWAQGKLQKASAYLAEALDIESRLAPEGMDIAWTFQNLGYVALDSGDPDRAVDYLQKALRIKQKLTPDSSSEAEVLNELGRAYKIKKQPGLALDFYLRAVDAVEKQIGRIGGTHDVKAGFRGLHREFFLDALQLLVEQGQIEKAFALQERSRARSFTAMLAERDLLPARDVPAGIQEQRRLLVLQYESTQAKILGGASPEDASLLEPSLARLRDLRRQIEGIDAEIRGLSSKSAAFRSPDLVDAEKASAVLDPGTLMLSYSVGSDRTTLFVLARGKRLEVRTLPIGADEIRRTVTLLSSLIRESAKTPRSGAFRLASLRAVASDLYRKLIEPVASSVQESQRLLILPDGPLHFLPWGALTRRVEDPAAGEGGRLQYLAEWKPLHLALSATAYSEIRQRNQPGPAGGADTPVRLAAFGDPVASNSEPLVSTRQEVEEITRLYSPGARSYLGNEATERNAKALPRGVRILHFATHVVLDKRLPFNSSVVLSSPATPKEGQDNGLLQAWEILDQMRLEADLVVLSACESGLGEELSGEGLIGLTRAFQYAGARSVMASLWKVRDRATAELMVRFYRHFRAGLTKDEALRAAQRELIQGPIPWGEKEKHVESDASLPYFWAAFQIYGDWQ